jgi:hypothetical protein
VSQTEVGATWACGLRVGTLRQSANTHLRAVWTSGRPNAQNEGRDLINKVCLWEAEDRAISRRMLQYTCLLSRMYIWPSFSAQGLMGTWLSRSECHLHPRSSSVHMRALPVHNNHLRDQFYVTVLAAAKQSPVRTCVYQSSAAGASAAYSRRRRCLALCDCTLRSPGSSRTGRKLVQQWLLSRPAGRKPQHSQEEWLRLASAGTWT